MARKDHIDPAGAGMLLGFTLLLAVNQVVIAVANGGFQPVFLAGLRSALCIVTLGGWMLLRGIPFTVPRDTLKWVILLGVLFAYEFICLFVALDMTTVGRASILFYTMPFWAALGAHLWIPGDRLTRGRVVGLSLAFAGVALALWRGSGGAQGSLLGDFLALIGATGWAGIALVVRATPVSRLRPVQQLFWQVAVSAPILLLAALFFGPLWRDPQWIHWAGLAFQVLAVVSAGFLFWFWLLTIYPASSVAAFGFLTPVFAVLLGWLLLGEVLHATTLAALALVCAGLWLVNRPSAPKARPGPDPT